MVGPATARGHEGRSAGVRCGQPAPLSTDKTAPIWQRPLRLGGAAHPQTRRPRQPAPAAAGEAPLFTGATADLPAPAATARRRLSPATPSEAAGRRRRYSTVTVFARLRG